MSQIKRPEGRKAIKDSSWLKLAKHFNCLNERGWQTAETGTFIAVQTALDLCKSDGIWQVLCDIAGIGKSHAAFEYAMKHRDTVFYVDCSDCSSKNDIIMEVARQLGLQKTSTYTKLWRDTVCELLLLDRPLLILDEFGDTTNDVIGLMKGLYNKANMGDHMALGAYFIGADNLKKRLHDGRKGSKPSYAEFWSRFDNSITSLNFDRIPARFEAELRSEIEKIVDKNIPDDLLDRRDLIIEKCLRTNGVRSIRKEIALQRKIKTLSK
jgi:hypothetical protein